MHSFCVVLFFLKISAIRGGSVLPPLLSVTSGEGFLFRQDSDVPLQSCQLTRNNKLYLLVPGQSQSHELITGEVVLPFDYNNTYECGVRVSNANVASQGVWMLTSIDKYGMPMNGSCNVTVAPQSTNCEIIDLITLQNRSCDSDFTDHHPNYECLFWGTGQMSQKQITNQADNPKALDSYRVTNLGDTILECELNESIKECFVEHVASRAKYSVQEGLHYNRYSAYKSNFVKGLCQFEIPREVNEDEVGIWMMTVYGKHGQHGNYQQNRHMSVPITKTCKFQLEGNVTLDKERIIHDNAVPPFSQTADADVHLYATQRSSLQATLGHIKVEGVFILRRRADKYWGLWHYVCQGRECPVWRLEVHDGQEQLCAV